MDALIIAGIVVAGIVVGVWSWAMISWVAPMHPMILSLIVLVLVVGIRAWLRARAARERGEGGQLMELLKPHPAEIGMGALCVALCSLWMVPALRATSLPLAQAQSAGVLAQALNDSDMSVRVRACELLFEKGSGGSDHHVLEMLEQRPLEARMCLAAADKRRPGSVTLIATKALSLWATRMIREEDEAQAEAACGLVEPVAEMSALAHQSVAPILMQCAAEASLDGVRRCCASRIGESGALEAQLGAVDEIDASVAAVYYGVVVRHMFGTGKGQDAGRLAVTKALGGERAENKTWAVQLGCAMMKGQGEGVVAALEGLVVFVEPASSCRPKDKEIRVAFGKPRVWELACEQIDEKRLAKDAEKEVCSAMNRAQVALAIDAAHELRRIAARAMADEEWAQTIASAQRVKGYGVADGDFLNDAQRELAQRGGFKDRSGRTRRHDVTWGETMGGPKYDRKLMLTLAKQWGIQNQMERYLDSQEGKEMVEKNGLSSGEMGGTKRADVIKRAVSGASRRDPSGMQSETMAKRLGEHQHGKVMVTPVPRAKGAKR